MAEKYMELSSKTDNSAAILEIYQVKNSDIGIQLSTFGNKDFVGDIRINLEGGNSGNTHEALFNLLDGNHPQTKIENPNERIGRIGDMLEMGNEYNALFLTPQEDGILLEIQILHPGTEINQILGGKILLTTEGKSDTKTLQIQTTQDIINALNAIYVGMLKDNKENPYRNPDDGRYLEQIREEIGNLQYI